MKVEVIPPEMLPTIWDEIVGYYDALIERNPEYTTIGFIKRRSFSGDYITLVAFDDDKHIKMAMVCEVIVCDTGAKILMVPHVSGKGVDEWLKPMIDAVYPLAQKLGCFKIMLAGARQGWEKMMKQYGGKVAHVTIEYDVEAWFKNAKS